MARLSGVAPAQLSRYENGTSAPRPKTLGKLANALSVDVLWLSHGSNTEQDVETTSEDSLHGVEAVRTVKNHTVEHGKFAIPKDLKPVLKELADSEGVLPSEMVVKLLKIGINVFKNIREEFLQK